MPIRPKILVVAPDPAFQRSLAFVLEAEGCRVDVSEKLPDSDELKGRYDCLVVDHRAIPAETELGGTPMVVLTSHRPDMIARGFTRVVVKPSLGNKLIEAVQDALGNEPQQPFAT